MAAWAAPAAAEGAVFPRRHGHLSPLSPAPFSFRPLSRLLRCHPQLSTTHHCPIYPFFILHPFRSKSLRVAPHRRSRTRQPSNSRRKGIVAAIAELDEEVTVSFSYTSSERGERLEGTVLLVVGVVIAVVVVVVLCVKRLTSDCQPAEPFSQLQHRRRTERVS